MFGVEVDANAVEEFEDSRDDIEPFGLDDLMVGDFLEVEGSQTGVVVFANEIERDDVDETRLRGTANEIDAGERSLSILGVAVVTDGSTQYEGLADEVMTADAFFDALASGQTIVEAQWRDATTDPTVPVHELSLED